MKIISFKKNSYHAIVCCTDPIYQKKIINKIIKKKFFVNI